MKKDPTGWTKLIVICCIIIAIYYITGANNYKTPEREYPVSHASYEHVNQDVGCGSKYSDDKKEDIFNSRYKNHWMVWSGEIVLASSDDVSLNIHGKGTQDLKVEFKNKNAGYNLIKGSNITVKFLMKNCGGCFLPFGGEQGTIDNN